MNDRLSGWQIVGCVAVVCWSLTCWVLVFASALTIGAWLGLSSLGVIAALTQ